MRAGRDLLLTLGSREWAGLVIAAIVALLPGGLAHALGGVAGGTLALLGAAVALVLALASLRHLRTLSLARRAHPPPPARVTSSPTTRSIVRGTTAGARWARAGAAWGISSARTTRASAARS